MNNYAVIVTYNPDIISLHVLCTSIIEQSFNVILVDNSSDDKVHELNIDKNCHIISLGENMGIAYAQNIGVNYAIKNGAEILTFFDQDSLVTIGLLSKLKAPVEKNNLTITAPVSVNSVNGDEYPSRRLSAAGISENIFSKNKKKLMPVDIVISSGVTTSVSVFNLAGMFDEDFFIDFVDVEWCVRCRRNDIDIFVVPDALMQHSIGDKSVNFIFFSSILHSPCRTYYKVRNSILLFRKNMKFIFVLRQVFSALVHNFFLIFCAEQKVVYMKFYIKGIFHGITGKVGRYR